jgi:hypothetical protein
MSAPSSEPEKYTIDEMMDRLKGRDASDNTPELVTRSDGSQAMKVKRRRRRTNQAVNEETKRNHRIQVVQIAGFAILVVVLGLAAGICVLYANSSSFRKSLLGKLEDSSGAKVSLIQFRVNPATANAGKAVMEWPEGNALASLDLTAVTAKIAPASFLGNTFSGEEIVAGQGELILRAPSEAHSKPNKSGTEGDLAVKFQRYSIPSLNIRFGGAAGQGRTLKGTEASFYPRMIQGQAEMRFQGGLFEFDAWPPVVLDRSYIMIRDGNFEIQSMRFMMPKAPNDRKVDKGFIDFSGTIKPLETGTTHTLEASVQELSLPFLAGADLGRFFLGSVDSAQIPDSNFLTFTPDSPESSVLEVTLSNSLNSRIDLGGFKFLAQLSAALDDRWYEYPNFDDEVALLVKRRAGKVEIDKINLVSRGRMVVRGSVANAEGGAISGTLRIGIPDTTVSAAPNKRLNLLFGEVREGYRWLDVAISGTSAVPEDNFKELYLKAAETPVEEPSAPDESPDKFENLIEEGE